MKWIRAKEAARRLSVSERTIYAWLRSGRVPGWKLGKMWMIGEDVVENLTSPSQLYPPTPTPSTTIKSSVSSSLSDLDAIKRIAAVATGAARNGITAVLEPRHIGAETGEAIDAALNEAEGEVWILGIGLPGFFGDEGRHAFTIQRMQRENRRVHIRALLVHPLSNFAKARTILETGGNELSTTALKASPIYASSMRSLRIISSMRERLLGGEDDFSLEVAFTDYWPSVHMTATETLCFVEPYHFGLLQELANGRAEGAAPVFVASSSSSLYKLMIAHAKYAWSGQNPFMPTYSPERVRRELTEI